MAAKRDYDTASGSNQGEITKVTWGHFMKVLKEDDVRYVGATERPIKERIAEDRNEHKKLEGIPVIYVPVKSMRDRENEALAVKLPPVNKLKRSGMEDEPGFVYAFVKAETKRRRREYKKDTNQGEIMQVTWEYFMEVANQRGVLYVEATKGPIEDRIDQHIAKDKDFQGHRVIYTEVESMKNAETQALATRPPWNKHKHSVEKDKPGFVYAFVKAETKLRQSELPSSSRH